jgi:hypothetical protein
METWNRTSKRRRLARSIFGWGSGGGVLLVAAMMALLPAATAATVHPASVIPVSKFGATIGSDTTKGACGKAKIVKSPSWAKKRGTFLGSVSSSAPVCAPQTAPNEGETTTYADLQTTRIHFASSGSYVMNVSWAMKVNETWSLTPFATCTLNYAVPSSMCETWTEDTLYAYVMIDDLSNSTWGEYGYGYSFGSFIDVYTSSFAYFYNSTYGNYSYGSAGAGSFSGTLNESNLLNLTGTSAINHSDQFEVSIYLEISTIALAYSISAKTTGKAAASASINAGTLGNGIKLRSITVT